MQEENIYRLCGVIVQALGNAINHSFDISFYYKNLEVNGGLENE